MSWGTWPIISIIDMGSALWESFAYHPTILTSWLYYFLTDYLYGNEITCEIVSFDPLITQKCNGSQTGSLINQKFISGIRLGLKLRQLERPFRQQFWTFGQ